MRDGWTLLIIENELLIAMNVEQIALDLGASTVTIMRMREALEFVPSSEFVADIAVVDYLSAYDKRMEILELVSGIGAELLVMTTQTAAHDDDLLAPALEIVRKPFSEEEMRMALRGALNNVGSG